MHRKFREYIEGLRLLCLVPPFLREVGVAPHPLVDLLCGKVFVPLPLLPGAVAVDGIARNLEGLPRLRFVRRDACQVFAASEGRAQRLTRPKRGILTTITHELKKKIDPFQSEERNEK